MTMSLATVAMCLVMILIFMLMAMALLDKKGSYMEEIIVAILITIWVISYAIRNR